MADTNGWLNLASVIRHTRVGEALRNVGYPIGGMCRATAPRKIAQSIPLSVKLAGLSGISAIGLCYYGRQAFNSETADPSLRELFFLGNSFHFIHTIGLAAAPATTEYDLVGFLMGTGLLLFSGSCYFRSLYKNIDASMAKRVEYATHVGCAMLSLAWFCVIF